MDNERKLFEDALEAHFMPAESDWFRRSKEDPEDYADESIEEAWLIWRMARSPYWLARMKRD